MLQPIARQNMRDAAVAFCEEAANSRDDCTFRYAWLTANCASRCSWNATLLRRLCIPCHALHCFRRRNSALPTARCDAVGLMYTSCSRALMRSALCTQLQFKLECGHVRKEKTPFDSISTNLIPLRARALNTA